LYSDAASDRLSALQALHVAKTGDAAMAMNVSAAREGEPVSEINTTPLIDVMLVLLIMLIVTLPPPRHAVKLDTPVPCEDCKREDRPPAVRIVVDFDGSLSWNGEQIATAELDERLAVEASRPLQPEVHIQPHRLAEYGAVAHVMASVQREGLSKLGVVGGT
jgi:biopolymer transport protein ExbD